MYILYCRNELAKAKELEQSEDLQQNGHLPLESRRVTYKKVFELCRNESWWHVGGQSHGTLGFLKIEVYLNDMQDNYRAQKQIK